MLFNEKEFDTLMKNCVSLIFNGLDIDKAKLQDLFLTTESGKTLLTEAGSFFIVFIVTSFYLKLLEFYSKK